MKAMFKKTGLIVSLASALVSGGFGAAQAAGGSAELKHLDWSFNGMFGRYDDASLQRGFQVYREVCSACHSLKHIAFRNLTDIGFSEAEVKALAAQYEIVDGPDEFGDMYTREGRPSDRIPGPFENEQQARASNGGALPPDLSLVAKSRVGGPDYIYSLLTGYHEPPAGVELRAGMNYNAVFPGNQIAMAPPLFEDMVEFADGTPATVEQMAEDVSHFLMWAAEPKLEERKSMGFRVLLFLIIMTGLFYFANKKVWLPVKRGENV
ncbi:MAG: cytochrome c1 [Alphaproteobacteria bacterium]|nr:MAG: cytochrome c1 [Alphaproteobacteria bacterium]